VFAQSPHDPVGDYELYVAEFRAVPIPEPSSLVLAWIGFLGLARHVRRR
jgi:PEP-CTERM motif